MKKFLMVILHLSFVFALYAFAVINIFVSIPNRDTYNLVMGAFLYIVALKHEKQVLKELDENLVESEEDGDESKDNDI